MSENENMNNINEKNEETQDKERLSDKERCQADPLYRSGNLIYRIGMIILCVLLLINAVLRLAMIEVVVGDIFCNTYLYVLEIIPCIMLVIGLAKTRKASKQHNNYNLKNTTVWLTVMVIFTVLIGMLCVADIITSPYNNAEVEEVKGGRVDQNMKTVKINSADGLISFGAKENAYVIEVYKDDGLFMKRLLVTEPVNTDNFAKSVEKGKGEDDYTLTIRIGGQSQVYNFYYQ